MAIALLALALAGTVSLLASIVVGYQVPAQVAHLKAHFLLGLLSTALLGMAHSFIMFFLIATGVEMKDMEKERGWGDSFRRRTIKMKSEVFPAMTFALLLVVANFILGAAAHTRAVPARGPQAQAAAGGERRAAGAAPHASSRGRTGAGARGTGTARTGRARSDRVDRAPAAEPIDIPTDDARRAESEPTMAREPNRDRLTIPAGTELQLVLESGLSSATSHVGDPVTARVARATSPDGRVLLPGGTVLKGRVYRAAAAGRVSGKSRLAVDFDRIVVRGVEHRLDTTAIHVEGPDSPR